MKNEVQDEHGNWVEATEEPYFTNVITRFQCWLGIHHVRVVAKHMPGRHRYFAQCMRCDRYLSLPLTE